MLYLKLQAKAKKAKTEIRVDIEKQIANLADKRASANTEIIESRHHTEDTWEDWLCCKNRERMRQSLRRVNRGGADEYHNEPFRFQMAPFPR